MVNEAGQILLPLTGIDRNVLYEMHRVTEIGLMFNSTPAKKHCLFILTSKSNDIEAYLKRRSNIISFTEISALRRLYEIKCKEEFKRDWGNMIKGKYSLVNKDTVFEVILPTLRQNRAQWKQIFYKDEEAIKELISKKLEGKYKGTKLRDMVDHLTHETIKGGSTIELKEKIDYNDNKIVYATS